MRYPILYLKYLARVDRFELVVTLLYYCFMTWSLFVMAILYCVLMVLLARMGLEWLGWL
jgi:hypothetical protein